MELAGGISQEDLNLFLQEADEQLQLLDEDIVRLEKESGNAELMQEIFRAAHTLKGSSAMVGHQRLSDLAHAMENVLDSVRKEMLAVSSGVVDALLHGLDVMRLLRQEMVSPDAPPTDIENAVAELNQAMKNGGNAAAADDGKAQEALPKISITLNDEQQARLEKALEEGKQGFRITIKFQPESGWASVRCFQIVQALSPVADIIASNPSLAEIEQGNAGDVFYMIALSLKKRGDIEETLAPIADVQSIEIEEFKERQSAPGGTEAAAGRKEDAKLGQTVRVDINRLDSLMEQVGELVINRNQISQLGKILAEKYGNDEDVQSLGNAVAQIGKIISTLQQDVMTVRLQPIEIVFSTLPRLVRDLSRKNNKKIEFIMEGQETEVDRSVIEHLRDPLLHLLRNSLDHGIEAPEVRTAAGKPEIGTIRLTAFHAQDNIIIKLKDDGKGIDPAVIRKTAVSKNLLTAEAASKLTDNESINMIFSSGFSTAQKVTEISGRGVGLDVVKTNVEAMNGTIQVESEIGRGTTFILTLPLTLAVIPALLVTTGETICAVPLSSIIETSRLDEKEVHTVSGREVAMFRGNVLPLLRLNEVFRWETQAAAEEATQYIVVVRYSNTQVGLVVDDLLEQQELVAKSLDDYIGGNNSFSGASIMGDGTVVLIIDVASLIKSAIAENQGAGTAVLPTGKAGG